MVCGDVCIWKPSEKTPLCAVACQRIIAKVFEKITLLLKGIIIAQLFITVMFQIYVHRHNGIKEGDYGVSYKEQMRILNQNQ